MKYNDREIAQFSEEKCDLEGRLNYSRPIFNQTGCKERWFKLKSNLLYYFRINDTGKIDHKQPYGLLVLENCRIQLEVQASTPFAFAIVFEDDWDRRHILSGRSEAHVSEWVNALKTASYEYWRTQLLTLQKRISLHTGKDPLFMVPRNDGCRNLQWSPQPTQSGFQCHIPRDSETTHSNPEIYENHSNNNWANFGDNPLIKFSPEKNKSQNNMNHVSKPDVSFDNSWEFFESLNFGGDNQKNTANLNDMHNRRQGIMIQRNGHQPKINIEKPRDGGRFNPFDAPKQNNGTTEMNYLKPIPHPPRRSRSPKHLRTQLLVNELHRTLSESRINENRPMPPLRKKAHGHKDSIHGSKFYLSDDEDDSDNSVTINPIYQSTSDIVVDFNKKSENDKAPEINLIDL